MSSFEVGDEVIVQTYRPLAAGGTPHWEKGRVIAVENRKRKLFLRDKYEVEFWAAIELPGGEITWRNTDDLTQLSRKEGAQ